MATQNRPINKKISPSISYRLETNTVKGIQAAKKATADLLKCNWNHYAEFARQRNAIQEQIELALIQKTKSYEISNWQRAVKYKYSLHPLSITGSLTYIGGRFNTGMGVNREIPFFPGLYIAENKDTALQEHLGQIPNQFLTPREVALTNPASETIISISGKFDKIFDLTSQENVAPFVELIKNFTMSKELRKLTNKLGFQPTIINDSNKLLDHLLEPNWRIYPAQYDVPSNSQIFGHLIYLSGIEGILYPSKLTDNLCLVVYPSNFVGTNSYIKLDDDAPHEKVPTKIDGSNWRLTEMSFQEISEFN